MSVSLIYGPQELPGYPVRKEPLTSPPACGASGCRFSCSSAPVSTYLVFAVVLNFVLNYALPPLTALMRAGLREAGG